MVVGQLNNIRVGFIIQARMKSTRLPNKVLTKIPLGTGKPIIKWIVDELKKSTFKNEIIVATSQNEENNILYNYCKSENIICFRGEEDNVLSRFIEIQEKENFTFIVRLTGDNPIIDIAVLDKTIQFHIANNNEYTRTEGLPIGMNFEVISPTTLLGLKDRNLIDDDKEHVTLYITKNDTYKKGIYKPIFKSPINHLRLTIDYPSDFIVVSAILNQVEEKQEMGVALIEKTMEEYPWVFEVNKYNIQKKQFTTLSDEIAEACVILENYDLKRVVGFLRK